MRCRRAASRPAAGEVAPKGHGIGQELIEHLVAFEGAYVGVHAGALVDGHWDLPALYYSTSRV